MSATGRSSTHPSPSKNRHEESEAPAAETGPAYHFQRHADLCTLWRQAGWIELRVVRAQHRHARNTTTPPQLADNAATEPLVTTSPWGKKLALGNTQVQAQGEILTSGNTFSAAIVTAARLGFYAGSHGEIVGEPMGDSPQFRAEAADRIVLPNSGLRIGYATGYHYWGNGCSLAEIRVCYPLNYIQGLAAGFLQPTLPVSWSYACANWSNS